jgi:hypothetical protein
VQKEESPNFSLFLDILHTLERIDAPYMVIGAFASLMYGSTRNTFDIDIIVDINWDHIQQLVAAYPPPRYYADALQMVESVAMGIMFNIIDTSFSDKADLIPISMEPRYQNAFQHRIRQKIDMPGIEPFDIWCARPEDIIVGKLMAWTEGRSRKHETDIYEMVAANRWRTSQAQGDPLDIGYIDEHAQAMSGETVALWDAVKAAVDREFP